MRIHATVTALMIAANAIGCGGEAKTADDNSSSPIAFVRNESIFVRKANGSVYFLTSGDRPQWFHDHRQLAFQRGDLSRTPPAQEVWITDPAGLRSRRVTSAYPEQVRFFALDEPGASLLYAGQRGISLVKLDGSGSRLIVRDDWANGITVSPDGKRLAYARNGTRSSPPALYVAAIDGSARRVVFGGTENTCGVDSPKWSPDGSWIAFMLCTDKGNGSEPIGIWLIHPDGRGLHRVTVGTDPAWSPNGQWIAYERSYTEAGKPHGLFKIHTDGRGAVQLTDDASSLGTAGDEQPAW